MTAVPIDVIGVVDTHRDTHHAAMIDAVGRRLADREFPTYYAGYQDLVAWLGSYGHLICVGIEGTGSYGAELARTVGAGGIRVVEVDRPDRRAHRQQGKSDPIDAYTVATAVLSPVVLACWRRAPYAGTAASQPD
jgi:transposase